MKSIDYIKLDPESAKNLMVRIGVVSGCFLFGGFVAAWLSRHAGPDGAVLAPIAVGVFALPQSWDVVGGFASRIFSGVMQFNMQSVIYLIVGMLFLMLVSVAGIFVFAWNVYRFVCCVKAIERARRGTVSRGGMP